jgi:tRNA threonylcarbamoyladenosine biosynthesis protein TsaE
MERSMKYLWNTTSAAESQRVGEAIGRRITHGLCVTVVGPLGAGKTVLVGGICRGLGVDEAVLSPSFVLYEEFKGRLPVAHVDLYRLEHESEVEELGLFDRIGGQEVILVEWGDRSESLCALADAVIEIVPTSQSRRRIEATCTPETAPFFEGSVP